MIKYFLILRFVSSAVCEAAERPPKSTGKTGDAAVLALVDKGEKLLSDGKYKQSIEKLEKALSDGRLAGSAQGYAMGCWMSLNAQGWHGTIDEPQTRQLDSEECKGPGGGPGPCEGEPCVEGGPHYGSWKDWKKKTDGTLSNAFFNPDTVVISVGSSATFPNSPISDLQDGSKIRYRDVSYDCPTYHTNTDADSETAPVSYSLSSVTWSPAPPSTFTTAGTFTFTGSVYGVSSEPSICADTGSVTCPFTVDVVKVNSLTASSPATLIKTEGEIDYYVAACNEGGTVTITATPYVDVSDSDLRFIGWSLTGGSGSGLRTRTLSLSQPGEYPLKAQCGTSEKNIVVMVLKVESINVDASNPEATNVKYKVTGGTLPSATITAPGIEATRSNIPEGFFSFTYNQNNLEDGINKIILKTIIGNFEVTVEISATKTEKSGPYATEIASGKVFLEEGAATVPVKHGLLEVRHVVTYSIPAVEESKTIHVGESTANISTVENPEIPTEIHYWTEKHYYNDSDGDHLEQDMTPVTYQTLPPQGVHFRSMDSEDNHWFKPDASRTGNATIDYLQFNTLIGPIVWVPFPIIGNTTIDGKIE